MDKNIMRKLFLIFLSIITFLIVNGETFGANYPLEITNIKQIGQDGMSANNRIFRAYPGIEYNIRAAVIRGLYPYTYSLTNAPSGMTINSNTGEITWTDPQSNATPTITVTDSENTSVSATWTISVTTAGFYFVDDINGTHANGFGCTNPGCGTGTLTNPWKSMIDWYRGTGYSATSDATYQGGIIYWRTGTYALEGYCNHLRLYDERIHMKNAKPTVWLAYPGESVTIDHKELGAGSCTGVGAFINWDDSDNSNNIYMDGITFMNGWNHAHRVMLNWDYTTFRRNTFHTVGPGQSGRNSSAIMTVSGGSSVLNDYFVLQDSTIYNLTSTPGGISALKFYSINKTLIEDNTIHDVTADNLTSVEGLALKAYIYNTTVRGNKFYNIYRRVINGNMNNLNNVEILYNLVYDTGPNGTALDFNNFSNATNMYIYKNTFKGRIGAESVDSSDGPFYLSNNVIVNSDSGTPAGSHIYHDSVSDPSRIILTNNLAGYETNNIIDTNGNLTPAYSSYLGTHGYQKIGWTPPVVPSRPTNLTIQNLP